MFQEINEAHNALLTALEGTDDAQIQKAKEAFEATLNDASQNHNEAITEAVSAQEEKISSLETELAEL